MMLPQLILRLISRWYNPIEQSRREQRTYAAQSHADRIQAKTEVTGQRVNAALRSYELSERRIAGRHRQRG